MRTDHAARLARGDELEFRAARTGMIFVLIFCVGFTVIGLCLVGGADGLIRVGGVALIIFFGVVGIPVAVWKLIRPTLQLMVSTDRGVWLRERGPSWIAWDEIASVERGLQSARPAVELRLTSDEAVQVPATLAINPVELYAILAGEHARHH